LTATLKYSHGGPYSSDRTTYSFELLPSKRELLLSQLIQEFSAIRKEDGFRTDPFEVTRNMPAQAPESLPIICVLISEETWQYNDTMRKVLSSSAKVQVIGYFRELQGSGGLDVYASESAGEALLDDMKRILAKLLLKNVNVSGFRWVVQPSPEPRAVAPPYRENNVGAVSLFFTAKIMYMGTDL
jgi:hypothetical protein